VVLNSGIPNNKKRKIEIVAHLSCSTGRTHFVRTKILISNNGEIVGSVILYWFISYISFFMEKVQDLLLPDTFQAWQKILPRIQIIII
jgi:hypothetical protein